MATDGGDIEQVIIDPEQLSAVGDQATKEIEGLFGVAEEILENALSGVYEQARVVSAAHVLAIHGRREDAQADADEAEHSGLPIDDILAGFTALQDRLNDAAAEVGAVLGFEISLTDDSDSETLEVDWVGDVEMDADTVDETAENDSVDASNAEAYEEDPADKDNEDSVETAEADPDDDGEADGDVEADESDMADRASDFLASLAGEADSTGSGEEAAAEETDTRTGGDSLRKAIETGLKVHEGMIDPELFPEVDHGQSPIKVFIIDDDTLRVNGVEQRFSEQQLSIIIMFYLARDLSEINAAQDLRDTDLWAPWLDEADAVKAWPGTFSPAKNKMNDLTGIDVFPTHGGKAGPTVRYTVDPRVKFVDVRADNQEEDS